MLESHEQRTTQGGAPIVEGSAIQAPQHSFIMSRGPARETPLERESFLRSHTLSELQEHYRNRGILFSSEEQLLQRIRRDFAMHLAARTSVAEGNAPAYDEYVVATARVRVIGCSHSRFSKAAYHQMYEQMAATESVMLCEQGIGTMFTLPRHTVPVADWAVAQGKELFAIGFWTGLDLLRGAFEIVRSKNRKAEIEDASIPPLLLHPVDGLPEYVALQLKIAKGGKLDFIEQRSAYQAEFLRHYRPERDKAILVGSLHANQIGYFLMHGTPDPEIVACARAHAHMAENKSERYRASRRWHALRTFALTGSGTLLGASPYFGLVAALHWFL